MTIFLMVIKQLIKDELNPLSTHLGDQIESYSANKDLSTDQKEIVDTLDREIQKVEDMGDDKTTLATIGALIDNARNAIKERREFYKYKEQGNTKDILDSLKLHSTDFYEKLTKMSFKVIDKPYYDTPENIVYYHATFYYGQEIFSPMGRGMDVEKRNQKEKKLEIRLIALSKLIKPSDALESRKVECLRTIDDIGADNQSIIKGGKDDTSSLPVPGMSFFGVSITLSKITQCFAPSEGRLAQQFNFAARKIRNMTDKTFKPQNPDEIVEVEDETSTLGNSL